MKTTELSHEEDLGAVFSKIAKIHKNKVALYYPDITVTYDELEQQSNRISSWFNQKQFNMNEPVVIIPDKSPVCFAIMLGAIKSGIPYVNLDAKNPPSRSEKILRGCQPQLIFAQHSYEKLSVIQNLGFPIIHYDAPDFESKINQLEPNRSPNRLKPEDSIAYLMFTSGSTGFPKAAVITQKNVLSFISWAINAFDVKPTDVFTGLNPLHFDNSVFDFFLSLFTGASLAPIAQSELVHAKKVSQQLEAYGCTIWFSVPSLLIYFLGLRAISKESLPSLNTVIFGGEAFPKASLKALQQLWPKKQLVNVYGPTECTCICSFYKMLEPDLLNPELLPLGTITPNFEYEILDSNLSPVKRGELGNLMLYGEGVGRGYFNNEAQAAKSFLSPGKQRGNQRKGYLTGDLVWEDTETGLLHFKSRLDFQIKHKGHRIELQEIETIVGQITGVLEVAVIYQEQPFPGQISAVVVLTNDIDLDSLESEINTLLPSYMKPTVIMPVERLPKNASGKTDRSQLPLLLSESR